MTTANYNVKIYQFKLGVKDDKSSAKSCQYIEFIIYRIRSHWIYHPFGTQPGTALPPVFRAWENIVAKMFPVRLFCLRTNFIRLITASINAHVISMRRRCFSMNRRQCSFNYWKSMRALCQTLRYNLITGILKKLLWPDCDPVPLGLPLKHTTPVYVKVTAYYYRWQPSSRLNSVSSGQTKLEATTTDAETRDHGPMTPAGQSSKGTELCLSAATSDKSGSGSDWNRECS